MVRWNRKILLLFFLTSHSIVFEESAIGLESCYDLGFRYGLCATKSINGILCKPENDIIIPVRCRDKIETKNGIKAGVIKANHYIKSQSIDSDGSIDIQSTRIETLRELLKGKSKTEVRDLVGAPDRVEIFSGNECWIYGNTHTSSDIGIVFDAEAVMTVTFY